MEILTNGATDVTRYVVLRDENTGLPKTDVTVTDIDLYYLEQGAAMASKVDCSALVAANSAHDNNSGYNVGQGLYRIDWPDEAFDGGVNKDVYLIVVHADCITEFEKIRLVSATRGLTGTALPDAAAGDTGGAAIVGSAMTLEDASIKSTTFDETTMESSGLWLED